MTGQYDVLNPWADADPVPLKGIASRPTGLEGKTVGLFALTYKRASKPILASVEEHLKARFPDTKFSLFQNPFNLTVAEMDQASERHSITPEFRDKFEEWAGGIDVAVTAIGD